MNMSKFREVLAWPDVWLGGVWGGCCEWQEVVDCDLLILLVACCLLTLPPRYPCPFTDLPYVRRNTVQIHFNFFIGNRDMCVRLLVVARAPSPS